MNKIEIFTISKWASKHWKAIISCYNSSPYFKYYKDDFENIGATAIQGSANKINNE